MTPEQIKETESIFCDILNTTERLELMKNQSFRNSLTRFLAKKNITIEKCEEGLQGRIVWCREKLLKV